MAGLSAAWRLSESGWRDRFESITVYQRGWRLGGKAASSRGDNGRIEEHGLHIWLGSYENAFALLRECYAELDRPTTDPGCPIPGWRDALHPAKNPGLAERFGDDWLSWLGTHPRDDGLPGEPGASGRELTVVSFVERALRLLVAYFDSLRDGQATGISRTFPNRSQTRLPSGFGTALGAILAALAAAADPDVADDSATALLDDVMIAVRNGIDYERQPSHRRGWLLLSLLVAAVRGILADHLVTHPRGFRAINDEEFGDWVLRHGGHPDVLDSAMVRGLYDLMFGYAQGDPDRPSVAAGQMVFLIAQVLFGYRGALFWKMTAGMGDVVIAPLYQALRRRGVEFEFFHRLDALHLDSRRHAIDTITLGRQANLADGVEQYEPLTLVKGLPVFPTSPLGDQLQVGSLVTDFESHFCTRRDVEIRTLRLGADFDHVILAVSMGMIPTVAAELTADRPEWWEMSRRVRTVATHAFQLWLRPTEPDLGWHYPGATISAYLHPFETWASMPQTLWAEDWPPGEVPGTAAYFCGSLDAPWPTTEPSHEYVSRYRDRTYAAAANHVECNLQLYLPKAFTNKGFNWHIVHGARGKKGVEAMATQHVSVNLDPSDRYVQSVPGSDKYRLRPDESGYHNLVLAGDWTDCGMNAGCIEAAVMSGLQAANALLGRGRFHRIRGYWLP